MSNKKRIAKNSLYLYIRMGLMTIVSLYTSRVVLENLGIDDFGVYSVVGGVAVMFTFFSNALNSASQRFITYAIGKGDLRDTQRVFSMSMNCHVLISLIIIVLSELIGLWLVNYRLDIPAESLYAANWVFQLSLASCILGIINVPYTGCITAYEKMSIFAWLSIIRAVLKLVVAWLIVLGGSEKLIFYTFLLFLVSLIMFAVSRIYCLYQFNCCRYKFYWNKSLFKEMMSFTSCALFKTGAIMGVIQGNNILINLYGGVVASAAMGIANQVNGTIFSFIQNVQIAFDPQITKTIAQNDTKDNMSLMTLCAKYASYSLLLISLPLILHIDFILELWLKTVPEWANTLCIFSILSVLVACWTGPLYTTVLAYGNIKKFEILTSMFWLITIPFAWLALVLGMPFKYVLLFKIIGQLITLVYSIYYIRRKSNIDFSSFISDSIVRVSAIIIIDMAFNFIIFSILPIHGIMGLIISIFISVISTVLLVYALGLSRSERISITSLIKVKLAGKNSD